jgi:RNA processing factor Prp31
MSENHELDLGRKRLVLQELIARWENTHYQHEVNHRVNKVIKNEVGLKANEEGMINATKALDLLDKEIKRIEKKLREQGEWVDGGVVGPE